MSVTARATEPYWYNFAHSIGEDFIIDHRVRGSAIKWVGHERYSARFDDVCLGHNSFETEQSAKDAVEAAYSLYLQKESEKIEAAIRIRKPREDFDVTDGTDMSCDHWVTFKNKKTGEMHTFSAVMWNDMIKQAHQAGFDWWEG